VTDKQLEKMLMRIPKDERERFIDGTRPEGRGQFFNKEAVYECENDDHLYTQEMADLGKSGWAYEKMYGAGPVFYREPPSKGGIYIAIGDPGVGEAPRRDAPVWLVWEIAYFPEKPARLVYFWWGNGHGRISPWIGKMLDLKNRYNPIFTGMDSTGTQKNMATLINEYVRQRKNIDETDPLDDNTGLENVTIPKVTGLDFSGSKKITYLHALRLFVEGKLLTWPKGIVGIRSQLSNYDPEKDRLKSKLPQDVVAAMAMSAHSIRGLFNVDPQEYLENIIPNQESNTDAWGRSRRKSAEGRSQRSNASRQKIYSQG
jgi:hypothetical protein